MSYRLENIKKVREELDLRRERAERAAEKREREVKEKIEGYAEISAELAKTEDKIWGAISSGKEDIIASIEKLRLENIGLQKKLADMLSAAGYPADYTEPEYTCSVCGDTGYVDTGVMCACMKKLLSTASAKSSGLGKLIKQQRFDNFSLKYYEGEDREQMSDNVAFCRRYAESFSQESESLLMIGGTGLGKTHISTAIAGVVMDNGFDVVYETAQNVFFDFEKDRFSERDSEAIARYRETDLLIIDDLGAELSNKFTVSCLYNVINSRICDGKPTIINTNLDRYEIRDRYEDRITSRLFGEFLPIFFTGRDVRAQKIREE